MHLGGAVLLAAGAGGAAVCPAALSVGCDGVGRALWTGDRMRLCALHAAVARGRGAGGPHAQARHHGGRERGVGRRVAGVSCSQRCWRSVCAGSVRDYGVVCGAGALPAVYPVHGSLCACACGRAPRGRAGEPDWKPYHVGRPGGGRGGLRRRGLGAGGLDFACGVCAFRRGGGTCGEVFLRAFAVGRRRGRHGA